MSNKPESPLLAAARALSEDLSRFQALSDELGRLSINSDKTLQRARHGLQVCSAHEIKLAESLRAFAQAMQQVQTVQQQCMDQTAQAARRVETRQLQRAGLEERMALLAQKARAVSLPIGPAEGASSSQMLSRLDEVEHRLEALIEEVSAVSRLAQEQDWQDLLRDTQSLREQLQALRNRVLLSRRKLAQNAPS